MQRLRTYTIVFVILALLVLPSTTSSQDKEYPPEFSPLRTSRPAQQPQGSLTRKTKFLRARNPIPNRYIVVLNDDVAPDTIPLETRRERIRERANSDAAARLGTVGYVYETALKGYSIELPDEDAAIELSRSPEVKWVEEDERLEPAQAPPSPQPSPPWGLDAIDGTVSTPVPNVNGRTNGIYVFNATGAGVKAYVLDTGINTGHQDFLTPNFSRASQAADCMAHADCRTGPPAFLDFACGQGMPNANNNDCWGHGTHVAGTLGGNNYGVAKGVSIKSVKVCAVGWGCPASVVIAGINWVTSDHIATNASPAVANISLNYPNSGGFNPPVFNHTGIVSAVTFSIDHGVTYVNSAGNSNVNAADFHPAHIPAVLTVGATDWTASRWVNSNWGPVVDLFAPGVNVVSALSGNQLFSCPIWNGSNNSECVASGTSTAAPHVAGAVAMYMQGRPGVTGCSTFPKQGPAPPNGNLSTCPDRVTQFIKANANLNRLSNVNGTVIGPGGIPITVPSANRFLWNVAIPGPANAIDNQRFFVWQHYADFLVTQPEPDENGLNFWTGTITGTCGTGLNDNNACTRVKRIDVSRAFWIVAFPSLFNGQGTTNNAEFVRRCYEMYLRRTVPPTDSGFQFWLNALTSNYGNPANWSGVNNMIEAFTSSAEYRRRFGP